MDAINILVALNLLSTFFAQLSNTKAQLLKSFGAPLIKPVTYLQKIPLNISALILFLSIAGLFGIFRINFLKQETELYLRLGGLLLFLVFSWLQIKSYKTLGQYYSQDIVIIKDHKLVQEGLYKYIRHPQYLSQILADLGIGIALLSYIIIPVVLLIEIPLFILRSKEEERIMSGYFKDVYAGYKKNTKAFIPFIL